MCQICRDRSQGDPRIKAFRNAGLLETLTLVEANKVRAGSTAYVVCTAVEDGPQAAAKAAVMAITDESIYNAKVREVLICLN